MSVELICIETGHTFERYILVHGIKTGLPTFINVSEVLKRDVWTY